MSSPDALALPPPQDAQARLAAIVESSDDAIVSKDLNGIIMSWNRGAERIFGYTAPEVIGRPVTILIPENLHDEEPSILERIRRGERIDHYETIRQRKDGTLIDISLTVSPILDREGRVVGASKIARDVTESKLTREATQRLYEIGKLCVQAQDDFEQIISRILDTAIWIAAADKGNVQLCDDVAQLNIVAHRGFEQPFLDFFASVTGHSSAVCGHALMAGDRVVVEDITASEIFRGQPSLAVLLAAGVRAVQSTPLISSKGILIGMISTHFARPHRPAERQCQLLDLLARQAADYIERRRSERQREQLLAETAAASRAKDEFLAMLGHELRNPLSAVRNAITAASLDEDRRERALEIARRQSAQLARIVDDLLDVARITHGRVPLRKKRMALDDVLQRAVDAARPLMDERGHTIRLALAPEPIEVEADPTRIEQALANLLTNAAKYTDPGGTVTVTAERNDGDAIVRIQDTGVGIAPELLPRVFDLFAQGSRGLDRAQGGLGIGLTVVRRIAELHGGTVQVRSPGPGGGSEFIVRLPALPSATHGAALHASDSQRRLPRAAHPTRVILVEDNPDAAESLVVILELFGHHVRVASEAAAGLRMAHANVPDIMLIDIGLPGMNGYELAEAIRRDAALKHVVLVALTGYGRAEDKERALSAGFDYHLAKPVEVDALGDLVARLATQPAGDPPAVH